MLERTIQKNISKVLKTRYKALVYKISGESNRGIPDLLVVLPNSAVAFMEVKTEKGVASELQKHVIAKLYKYGQEVHIVRSVEEAVAIVDRLVNS